MAVMLFLHLLTLAAFMGLLISAAVGDVKMYRIPNAYSLVLLGLYPLFAWSAPHSVAPLASVAVMTGVLAVSFAAFAMGLCGGGDAKLLSAVALFAGPPLIFEFLLTTALAGGLMSLLLAIRPVRFSMAAALDQRGHLMLRNALLADVVPYGVAIAAGGIYLTLRLVGAATDGA